MHFRQHSQETTPCAKSQVWGLLGMWTASALVCLSFTFSVQKKMFRVERKSPINHWRSSQTTWEAIHFKFTSKYAHNFTSPQQSISPKESLIPQGELHTSLSMGNRISPFFSYQPVLYRYVFCACTSSACFFFSCPPPPSPPEDEAIFKVSGSSSDRPGKKHCQQHWRKPHLFSFFKCGYENVIRQKKETTMKTSLGAVLTLQNTKQWKR